MTSDKGVPSTEKSAYTLTDTATWLKNKSTLRPLVKALTKKEDLKNQYSVLLLNQIVHDQVASTGAEWMAAWLVSNEGQTAIGAYGKAELRRASVLPQRLHHLGSVLSRGSRRRPPKPFGKLTPA